MRIKRVKYREIEKFPEFNFQKEIKKEFSGSGQAPFIGRFGYPYVNIGILSPQFSEKTGIYDKPKEWSKKGFSVNKIAGMRYELVNSRQKADVYSLKGRIVEVCQEVGRALKPVELEVNLKERPRLKLEQESEIIPYGPIGKVKKIRVTENIKVDRRVEKVVEDTDLKAEKGIWGLYRKGFEENFLTKLISVGNLGLKKNRKLVPTRWSITAVDDILGKQLIEEVKKLPEGDYKLFFWRGLGKLLFSDVFSRSLEF